MIVASFLWHAPPRPCARAKRFRYALRSLRSSARARRSVPHPCKDATLNSFKQSELRRILDDGLRLPVGEAGDDPVARADVGGAAEGDAVALAEGDRVAAAEDGFGADGAELPLQR